ncbi:MAG: GntR family transcriptional regulator [Pusillimonas sp.]
MKKKIPSGAQPSSIPPWPPSHIPRYVVIADRLRQRIASGVWRAGRMLPSLHDLADEFEVARPTARQAVQLLVAEGLLSSQRGQGTFVTQAAAPVKTTPLETSLQALAETYHGLKPRILEIDENPRILPIDSDGKPCYVYMRRLHSLDGRPYCVISLYIAQDVFKSRPAQFRTRPVIPLMLSLKGLTIKQAHQTLSITSADAETAQLLGIPVGAPLANMVRVFQSDNDTIVYYAEVSYRGDAVRMEIDLKP